MAESQILGLFASPQMVEDAVRQEIRQQAPQFDSAPNQRLFTNIAQAGAAFDPRVQRARQQQEVARGVSGEFGTSQYYRDMAEQFRQRGMLQSAIVAADKAKQLDKDLMDAAKLKYGAISFVQYGSKVPEIRRLVMQIEATKDPAVKIALERELTNIMKQGAKEVSEREAMEAGAAKQAELDEIRIGNTRADLQERFEKVNNASEAVLSLQNNIESAVDNNEIFTGPLAKIKENIYSLAQSFGLTSEETNRMVENTQLAESIIGQALLEQIKTLGTNPSNADREFLAKTLPTVLNSPGGIKKIIEYMRIRANKAREDAEARLTYFQTPDKEGKRRTDLLGYQSAATKELAEFFRANDVKGSTEPGKIDPTIDKSFRVESKHQGDDTAKKTSQVETAEQALTAIDQSPVTQQDSDNLQSVRDQRDQASQAPAVTPGETVETRPTGEEPPMARVAPQTEQEVVARIQQIDADLTGASDLLPVERRQLTDERTRLAEQYNRGVQQRDAVIDTMVLAQMGTFASPLIGQISAPMPESQKRMRLEAMPRSRKLIIVENMLRTKANKEGQLSPAEQNLLRAVRDELRQLGAGQ